MKLRRHLRLAFHDWMWDNGSSPQCGRARRLCRRRPLYFADPYLDGIPRDPKKFDEWWATLEKCEVVGKPRAVVESTWPVGATWPIATVPQTWSGGGSVNYVVCTCSAPCPTHGQRPTS